MEIGKMLRCILSLKGSHAHLVDEKEMRNVGRIMFCSI